MAGAGFITYIELGFDSSKCPPLIAQTSWYKDDPSNNKCEEK